MSPTTAYLLLWTAGLWAAGAAALAVLHARGVLSTRTALALLPAALGFLVGSKWQSRLEWMPLGDALRFPPSELFTGGRRIDLGLVLGMVLALAWAAAARVSRRQVADALVVGACVLMPIGRLGCLVAGCCMGAVCHVGLPFCLHFPPGTEAYNRQLDAGLIGLSATASLPAHPLPAYFAVAALGTLGVLWWALRRGVRPGTLVTLFCLIYPATKLALDPLRATPSPSPLMAVIPLAVLLGATVIVATSGVRRLLRVPARRGAWSASCMLVLVLAGSVAHAGNSATGDAASVGLPREWSEALFAYAGDPWRHRAALRRLGRRGDATLPPVALLALGDARLRSGSRGAARRYFARVLDDQPGQPWEGWAEIGLGWLDVADGDLTAAQRRFGRVAESASPSRALAVLVIALIDAERGDHASAVRVLDALADVPDAPPGVRDTALLAGGYVRYWDGRWAEAAEHLDHTGMVVVGSRLWDDARYAAALARWKGGDTSAARQQLRALALVASVAPPDERITPALLALQPRTLLDAGLLRYRRLPFTVPEDQVVALLDRDGPELARATLRGMGESVETPPGSARAGRRSRAAGIVQVAAAPAVVTDTRAAGPAPSHPWVAATVAILAAVAVFLILYLNRDRRRAVPRRSAPWR